MSTNQAKTIQVISGLLLKVVLGACGTLLTIAYLEIKDVQKEQAKDINEIKVDVAILKADKKH